jgi:hypothetical protein
MSHAIAFAIDFAFHVEVFVGAPLLLQRVAELGARSEGPLGRETAPASALGRWTRRPSPAAG